MSGRHRAIAAAVTAVAALAAWLLVEGPLTQRLAGDRGTCGIPAECLADADLWGSVAAAIGLSALAWAIGLLAALGLMSVALAHGIAHRWPAARAARVGAALLTYGPPLALTLLLTWVAGLSLR